MAHKQGGKVTGSHTTVTEGAKPIVDFLERLETVTKIVLGVINNGARGCNGSPASVKIVDESGCVLIRVSHASSVQEIRVYSGDLQKTKEELARFVRNNKWNLRFRKDS